MSVENSRPLRILYIADSTSVHTQRWIKYFSDAGHKIYLITIGKKKQILPYAHHVINFNQFYYNSPTFITNLLKTKRLINSINPDILHGHFVHQYGWLAALSFFHPFILSPWGTDIFKLPHKSRIKFGKFLTSYALRSADVITVISKELKNESVKLGAKEKKVEVVFLGVDTSIFRPDIESKGIRKKLEIPENAIVILSNRDFAPLYNNDIVILSMKKVLQKYPNVVLVLQNAGGQKKNLSKLTRLAKEIGVAHSIRFLPQWDHHKMPQLYAMSDIYISVPSWDAGPVSLLEAMSSHCTPIISDLPAPREWIKDGYNGYVVPVRETVSLSNAICRLLEDAKISSIFNEMNRELIINEAENKILMKRVEDIYYKAISIKMV